MTAPEVALRLGLPVECTILPMKRSRTAILPLLFCTLGMAGCDPLFDIGGAYFPGWIMAALIAVGLTVAIRWVLVGLRLNEHLWLRSLAYIGLFTALSITSWLILFRY